ncbi:methylmalonyl-CoA epimerase [Hyphobacterium marinum]|uniref:Methylmalonyl-CoA epimerase n=1 Tax=Hyphobacterium marinum TaxID=3116574 RepID=A0ABU7M178_9PROT|nr:methylmalonyl-CoA epimerase [Hyphobacterium sp. Y6023]MEE2567546.1 methylmalonyl-CoA epimerase [Hyphobacterium sp. Y6023]
MKIGRLNHVGIATPDIEATKAMYATLYGADRATETKDFPHLGVRVCFVSLENSELELLEPLGEASPVHKFLERNPKGGQHHVCFEVDDIITARDTMRARGATVLGTGEPYIGAHGVPVIFVHPKNSDGVLVELMQKPDHD